MGRNTGLQEVVISSFQEIPRFNLEDWIYTNIENVIFLRGYRGGEKAIHIPGDFNGRQVVIPDLSIFPDDMTDLFIEEVNGRKLKVITDSFCGAFEGNKNIITLDLRGLDTSQVTDMWRMFCSSQIKELDVSGWNTSRVTNMGGMFRASQVKELDVSNWDTSRVTKMSGMFSNSQVKELEVSKWEMSQVTDMSGMFSDSRVKELDVSNWDTFLVTDTTDMFKNSQVGDLKLNDWDFDDLEFDLEFDFEELAK